MFHFRRKPFKANHSDARIQPPECPHLSPPLTALKPAKNPTSFFCHCLLSNTLFKAVKTLVLSASALNFSRKKENLSPQSQDIAETSRRPKGGHRCHPKGEKKIQNNKKATPKPEVKFISARETRAAAAVRARPGGRLRR